MKNNNLETVFEDGFFKPYFVQFVEYRRGMGEKVNRGALWRLEKLNCQLNASGCSCISQEMAEALLAPRSGLSETLRFLMVSDLRRFSEFLREQGIDAAAVPRGFMKTPRSGFRPYIFSDSEELAVINAADHYPDTKGSGNRQLVCPVIARLLFGTGMRIGEALSLTVGDVDGEAGVIKVIHGKNGVSRFIPVSESLRNVLAGYMGAVGPRDAGTPFFMSAVTGQAYSYGGMFHIFQKIFTDAGVRRENGKLPNIHSIRHTFCTKSLSAMLASGMDIYTAVPILAAYVGHVSYADTERYIHFTEQDYEGFLKAESSLGALIPEVADE